MSALLRGFNHAKALFLTGAVAAFASGGVDDRPSAHPPQRVVSMNLCTDQLAMLVAAPGQLHSVSYLAADPAGSAMAAEALYYTINHGLAEEIYLMQPDLVIAGSFSTRTTVNMLERLNVPVVVLEPVSSLEEVPKRLREMGAALGRETAAEALIIEYNQRLSALRDTSDKRPSAALYYANGYTSGDRTLAGQILVAAGFENAAVQAGYTSGGILPLEVLAMLQPDALISGRQFAGGSRSEEILDHPVVAALRDGRAKGAIVGSDWICGTPHVLRAVEDLNGLRQVLTAD